MLSSYQNSNFLKSRQGYIIQESEMIQNSLGNKQNCSYQLNKSNSQYQMNKSNSCQMSKNNSYINASKNNCSYLDMLKQRSGLLASKSISMIMADSKGNHYYGSNQNDSNEPNIHKKYNLESKSILKNHKNGHQLKVLTQSDLTQNQNEENSFFEPQEYQANDLKYPKSSFQRKYLMNENHVKQAKSDKISSRVSGQKDPRQIESDGLSQTQEELETPPFKFMPQIKLEIKNFSQPFQRIKISIKTILGLIPHSVCQLATVKKLTLTNCFISSLDGIQAFNSLQEVNLRKNQLKQVEELYRINCKQKLIAINIIGNDIEHYHLARYQNLSKVFPNLTELNDKNYAMFKIKQRGDMKRILKKSAKIQYELRKTLKKQTKRTDRALFKLHPQLAFESGTDRVNHCETAFENKSTEKDEYSYQKYNDNSNKGTSRSRPQLSEMRNLHQNVSASSFTNFNQKKSVEHEDQVYELHNQTPNKNSYSIGNQNRDSNAKFRNSDFEQNNCGTHPLKQVSLGNLENVPITKSVKYQAKSPGKNSANKENIPSNQIPLQTVPVAKNFLQIKTEGLDSESELNTHLHQPTATFAMQREKQQKYSMQNKQFMFKNKKGTEATKRKREQEEIFEDNLQNLDEEQNEMSLSTISRISQIPTKRLSNNRRSTVPNNRSRMQQNDNMSEQSFMTGNEFYNQNQNGSYVMGFSQLSQFRPNQSMDEDCLLKDNNNALEDDKIAISAAIYMQNLIRKSFYGLIIESKKRKNLPKKKSFF